MGEEVPDEFYLFNIREVGKCLQTFKKGPGKSGKIKTKEVNKQ